MSTTENLKAAYDKFIANGIGVDLPAMKALLAAIKEYLSQNAAN